MITIQDKQAFTDLSIIIKMMPKNMREKININFINLIEQYKDTDYTSTVNPNIPIREQELSETTKTLLALIYRDYLCDKEERKVLIEAENLELEKIQNEKRKKYEINFSERKTSQNVSPETSLIEYKKENILIKVFNIIKKFFGFN